MKHHVDVYELDRLLFKYFTPDDASALLPQEYENDLVPLRCFIESYEQVILDLLRSKVGNKYLTLNA